MTTLPPASYLIRHLSTVVGASLDNNHGDNFDHQRFGPAERSIADSAQAFEQVLSSLPALSTTYGLLADPASRQLFVELLAFRLLGHRKVKLPLGRSRYKEVMIQAEQLLDRTRSIDTGFQDGTLYFTDLTPIGVPLRLYGSAGVIISDFVIKQYEYTTGRGKLIGAKPDDIVIDAGGCWGNTALAFAQRVGSGGHVYSFEFASPSLRVFRANLELNPHLMDRIDIVEHPVWVRSGDQLFFEHHGPGTKVKAGASSPTSGICLSMSIDDLIRERSISRVSLIKMDVEGSELAAIEGAADTIRRFRPQLAISLYHKFTDLTDIPAALHELVPAYEFYLGHYSMHLEETVLYATT